MDYKNIGTLLRERRKSLNLTMKDVAEAVGVNEGTVSRWECGKIENMRREKIYSLSKILHLPIDSILGVESYEKIESAKSILLQEEIIKKIKDLTDDQLEDVNRYIEFTKSKDSFGFKKEKDRSKNNKEKDDEMEM